MSKDCIGPVIDFFFILDKVESVKVIKGNLSTNSSFDILDMIPIQPAPFLCTAAKITKPTLILRPCMLLWNYP